MIIQDHRIGLLTRCQVRFVGMLAWHYLNILFVGLSLVSSFALKWGPSRFRGLRQRFPALDGQLDLHFGLTCGLKCP